MMNHVANAGKKVGIANILLLLVGCHTITAPTPAVEVRYQTVTREVPRPCPVTVPQRPAPLGSLSTDLAQALAQVGERLAEWSGPGGYGERADAAIRTCTAAR